MITLVNFSHPLSDAGKNSLVEHFGGLEFVEIHIPVQVDLGSDLLAQAENIVSKAVQSVGGNARNIDAFIPPGLSAIAIPVASVLRKKQGGRLTCHMIYLKSLGTPPKYVFGGAIPGDKL